MRSLGELGAAVSRRRKALGLPQGHVARLAGVTQGLLSRFERGRITELGLRKFLAVLSVLELEVELTERGLSGTLDELRRERGGG
jgi:transcriptional regulator with XRE-family HTH domain